MPKETYSNYKAIQKFDTDGNIIGEWKTVAEAAREHHTCTKQIRRLIAKGVFRYKK